MGGISSVAALVRAGFVLTREGVLSALPTEVMDTKARAAIKIARIIERRKSRNSGRSEKLTTALNRLGPSWVKLGQFLATRPDVIGREMATDLERLQDRMEPFSTKLAKQAVQQSINQDPNEIFSSFSEPVAAASIAQVHKVQHIDNAAPLAMKVIRPNVRERFSRDMQTFAFAAEIQEKHMPASRRLRPVAVTQMLEQSARIEMDLRLEAAALSEMEQNTKGDAGFRVPAVNWELTGRDCLALEWIDGIKLGDTQALQDEGHDLPLLGNTLMQSFLRHTLRDGFFHADMHPGNLFVESDGTIVAVDLGIMGRLGRKEKLFLAQILHGFITRNYQRVAEVHFEAGYVPHTHDVKSFAQAIRAIGEPIHGQAAETISMAKLLTLLFEVTELFDMETRPELLLLQKTMVVVEGVARKLNPDFNMWQVSEPVVAGWIAENLGPVGIAREAADGLKSVTHLAGQLPQFATRLERLSHSMDEMAEKGLRFDPETAEQIGRSEAYHNRWGRRALILIALIASVVIIAHYM